MGLYIEPPTKDKRAWLIENSTGRINPPAFEDSDKLLVCLIDNGHFYAGAVIYSEAELRKFENPRDRRDKKWFAVEKKLLKRVRPDYHIYVNE